MKNELIKASIAIHISHKLSLFQLRIWNLLIANANLTNIKKNNKYKINLMDICKTLGTKNLTYIKSNLCGLNKKLNFNILEKLPDLFLKDTPAINQTCIDKGIFRYSFNSTLFNLLSNPKMYTKIDLNVEKKLSSKYGLILYELCCDYNNVKQTPWISINLLKQYMCGQIDSNLKFYRFSDKVLKTAIKDVNSNTPFSIKLDYKKNKTSVTHVKFLIEKKEEVKFQPAKFARTNIGANDIITSLEALSIPKEKAWKLYNAYSEDVIKNSIKLLKHNSNIQKIKNPAGWLYKAIKEGWAKESIPAKKEPVVIPKIKVNPKIIKTEKIHKLALNRYNSLSKEEREKLEEEFNYWGNTSFRKYIDYRTKKNIFIDMKMVNKQEQDMILKNIQK